jgi:hypothetical protein
MPLGLGIAVFSGLLFGTLLCFLTPAKMLLVVVAAPFFITLLYRPLWSFLLFAFVAASIPYTTISLGARTTISELLLLLTWMGILRQTFSNARQPFPKWRAPEISLFFLMLFSIIPFAYGQINISAEGSGLVNWLRWLLNLSAMFLAPLVLRDEQDRERLIVAIFCGMLLMLAVSMLMFLKNQDATSMIPLLTNLQYSHPESIEDIFSANYRRIATPWVHPNLTGGILALFVPLSIFYGWTRSGWQRVLGCLVAFLGIASLMLSSSRGAMVALALVLGWLVYKRVPHSRQALILVMTLGIALILFYAPLQERILALFSASDASSGIRMEEYRMFPEAMSRYPLGIGFKVDPPVPESKLLGISNLWLNFIYKLGIPGMALFILVTVFWWREVRPRQAFSSITRDNALWIGSVSGILAAILTGMFDHYYSFTSVLIAFFWLLTGLSLQEIRRLRIQQAPENMAKSPSSPLSKKGQVL